MEVFRATPAAQKKFHFSLAIPKRFAIVSPIEGNQSDEQPKNKMNTTKTYTEIANSFSLWQEYVDPSGLTSEAEFDAMTIEEKIAFQVSCFGVEEAAADAE
jgi:hypothetical protein